MSAGAQGASPGPAAPRGIVAVVGAGASNVKSTVALNLAVALTPLGTADAAAVVLADLDGAARRALRVDGPARVALPWTGNTLPVVTALEGADAGASPGRVLVVDPPPRFDAATQRALAAADLVLVPVDASALAMRVLRDVAARVAPPAGGAPSPLRVVLARRLPRSADRWGLLDRIEEVAPGSLLATTLPMARPAGSDPRAAVLYAPGTAAARAYAALAAEVVDALAGRGVSSAP